jgi:hypothetical protein
MQIERQADGKWLVTSAFAINETDASDAGDSKSQVEGIFELSNSYRGCPHCAARSFWLCGSCGHIACWDEKASVVECPWCGISGELSPTTITSLKSSTGLFR